MMWGWRAELVRGEEMSMRYQEFAIRFTSVHRGWSYEYNINELPTFERRITLASNSEVSLEVTNVVATAATYRVKELSQNVMWLIRFVQSSAGQANVKRKHGVVS